MSTVCELSTPEFLVSWMIVDKTEGEGSKHWISMLRRVDGNEVYSAHSEDYDFAQDNFLALTKRVTESL